MQELILMKKNSEGLTILHVAITQKCEDTVRLIFSLQADFCNG